MREPVREAALAQERDELHHGSTTRLEFAMVLLGEVPDEDVERNPLALELRGHLDREERVGKVRDPQRALQRVVIRNRDEIHPAALAHAVDALGFGVGLAEPCPAERVVAAVGGVARVRVQVAARHFFRSSAATGRFLHLSGVRHGLATVHSPTVSPYDLLRRGASRRPPNATFQKGER
jgi:hypothetical protein